MDLNWISDKIGDNMSEKTGQKYLYTQLYGAFKEAFPKSKGFNGFK